MIRVALLGLVCSCAALTTIAGPVRADDPSPEGLKVVVHVNTAEPGIQGAGLKNMANVLKDAPDTRVEVVCHGGGIGLVEKARSEHPEAVAALIKQGVRFVACENTMRGKSIRPEDLLPGVGTVPSGALEVIRKQRKDGYAYFKP